MYKHILIDGEQFIETARFGLRKFMSVLTIYGSGKNQRTSQRVSLRPTNLELSFSRTRIYLNGIDVDNMVPYFSRVMCESEYCARQVSYVLVRLLGLVCMPSDFEFPTLEEVIEFARKEFGITFHVKSNSSY